jgi:chromate reductase
MPEIIIGAPIGSGIGNFKILAISGSLRAGSTNTMALRAAQKLAPKGMEIELADISGIPLYNGDLHLAGEPEKVSVLINKIRDVHAVLIASPEYNFSIPGGLKNALDWISRPSNPPFNEKPIAIMGVSPGQVGTARMQYHLRQVLVFMNAFTLNKPEVFINNSSGKFDSSGELIDVQTAKIIVDQLNALKLLSIRVGAFNPAT